MKILHFINVFLPTFSAGAQIYCYQLSAEQLRRGNDVDVIAGDHHNGKLQYSVEHRNLNGIKVHYITNELSGLTSFEQLYQNPRIAEISGEMLDLIKPDLVHVHCLDHLSITCIDETKNRGIPLVFTLHDFWLQCELGRRITRSLILCKTPDPVRCGRCNKRMIVKTTRVAKILENRPLKTRLAGSRISLLRKLYCRYLSTLDKTNLNDRQLSEVYQRRNEAMRQLIAKVDLFTAPSEFLRRDYIEWGIPEEKIVHCDIGFPKERFDRIDKTRSEILRCAFIGQIVPEKGITVLIKAFNGLQDQPLRLTIYGSDRFDKSYYRAMKRSANRNNIVFPGLVANENLNQIYREIDLLIVPSLWYENSPLTIREALLARTPVLASNLGGMAEYVEDGINGLLFRVGDHDDLVGKLKRLIDNPEMLKRFDFSRMKISSIGEAVDQLESIYRMIQRTSKTRAEI